LYNSSIQIWQNLMLKVWPARTRTKVLRRRRYWLIAASTIDWSNSSIRHCFEFIDVSYFGAVNFLSQSTPDAVFCQIKHTSVYCALIKSLKKFTAD